MERFHSFLKTAGGNEGDICQYPTRLDTYGKGCQHDCSYCYAKSLLSFRELWNPEDPAVADVEEIKKALRQIRHGTVLRMGGMTDCFMPLELEKRATYRTIKELNRRGIGYLIVTKSHLVAEDEYMKIYDPDLAHFQITVTTLDDDLSLSYEKASIPSLRIKAILKLQEAGFDVAVRLSPIIEEFMDFKKLNNLGIQKAVVEFLRVNTWIKRWFDIDYKPYVLKQGGYRFLRLADNKTAELAGWDFEALDLEMFDISDIDMSQFGFDADIEISDDDFEKYFVDAESKEKAPKVITCPHCGKEIEL